MREFSQRGERCTTVERELVEVTDSNGLRDMPAIWLALMQRLGCDTIAAVLDEFGGEKIHVPTRMTFFAALARCQRNEQIRMLRARGMSPTEIAALLGMTPGRVCQVLSDSDDSEE